MKKIIKTFMLFILFYGIILHYPIYAENQFIDIGLKFGDNAPESVRIISNGLVLCKEDEKVQLSVGAEYIVKAENDGSISILDSSGDFLAQISPNNVITSIGNATIKVFDKNYRGGLKFINTGGRLTVINRVNIEHYLYGVVPNEIGSSSDMEALKAQAIAARSYAVRNMNKYINLGFNLTDDTRCQVYKGFDTESGRSNQAVNETSGLVAYYDGQVAQLVYNASSGGATVSAENVWGSHIPYLIDKKDTFSVGSSYDNWEYEISKEEIENKLKNKGKNIGSLLDVKIDSQSKYGYVLSITFKGTSGDATFKGDYIRNMFGNTKIKSQLFTINEENSSGKEKLESFNYLNQFISENISKDAAIDENRDRNSKNSYLFRGSGYGHGVGMSQIGAQNMAKAGYNYAEIIDFYYPGVEIR